jgi:four helix bundle protein
MKAIANHRDWVVWQHSIALATALHVPTRPDLSNAAELREQMRATSIALATQIAECSAVANRTERIRVLCGARSLLARIEVQVQVCERMQTADDLTDVEKQIATLAQLLDGVIQRWREQPNRDARSIASTSVRRSSVGSAAAAT